MMRMTFSGSTRGGPLLFKFWDVNNGTGFAVTIVAIVTFALLMEALRRVQRRLRCPQLICDPTELHRSKETLDGAVLRISPRRPLHCTPTHEIDPHNVGGDRNEIQIKSALCLPSLRTRITNHIINTLITVVQYTLGYTIMLIVMSYITWYFISILIGCGAGYYVFVVLMPPDRTNQTSPVSKQPDENIGA